MSEATKSFLRKWRRSFTSILRSNFVLYREKNPDRPETEQVKLVVQKKQSHKDVPDEILREEILAFAKEKLSPYKVPKVVQFMEMPLTAVGKINKKALR